MAHLTIGILVLVVTLAAAVDIKRIRRQAGASIECYSCTTARYGSYICSEGNLPEPAELQRVPCTSYCVVAKLENEDMLRGCADQNTQLGPVPSVPSGGSACKTNPSPGAQTCFCDGNLCNVKSVHDMFTVGVKTPVIVGVDECASNPCKNGARCIDGDKEYTCICSAGYYGCNCNFLDVDECASNPCQNGATCVDGNNKYTCICPANTFGPLCEIKNDVCQNGGQLTCSCPTGSKGKYCQEKVRSFECYSCTTASHGSYICSETVLPERTEVDRVACTSYCVAAKFADGTMLRGCADQNTQLGPIPDVPIGGSACKTNPSPGTQTCFCYDNLCNDKGLLEMGGSMGGAVNPCSSGPCTNGGQCVAGPLSTYTCKCINGYRGADCDTPPARPTQCYECSDVSHGLFVCSFGTLIEPREVRMVPCASYCGITRLADRTVTRSCGPKLGLPSIPDVPAGGSVCVLGPGPNEETCFCSGDLCNIIGWGPPGENGVLNGGVIPLASANEISCTCGPPCSPTPYKCVLQAGKSKVHCDCGSGCGCSYT